MFKTLAQAYCDSTTDETIDKLVRLLQVIVKECVPSLKTL